MTYDAYENTGGSKKDAAQQEAGAVKDTALSAGQDVKNTAVGEAADLKDHAVDRAQDLLAHSREQVGSRLSEGQNQLAQFVGEISDELQQMARSGGNGGYASGLAGQLASRGQQVANYLGNSEPGDVVDEVRRYAARRPVAFLGISLAAGVLAGRLVRGLQASQQGQIGTGRSTRQFTGGQQYTQQYSGYSSGQQYTGGQQYTTDQYVGGQQYATDQYTGGQQYTTDQYTGGQSYTGGQQFQANAPLGHEEHSSMFADTPDLGTGQGRNEFGAPAQQQRAGDDFRGGQL